MADTKSFLKLIKAMESSGGKDVNHRTIASGMHEGDAAVGSYALMPNTAKELAAKGNVGPSDDVIKNLENPQVAALLKENPDLTREYVKQLAEKLLIKTKGDPALGMVGWRWGHNMPLKDIKRVAEENPEYIEKVDQRIGENRLKSEMPSIFDMLKPKYKDEPMSKRKKNE